MFTRPTHSIPFFDGRASRTHHAVALWKLRLAGQIHGLRRAGALSRLDTLVHFAGFPRSGHSLIGAIVDAHPQARIAHELDSLGLLEAGLSMRQITALMDRKAAEFTAHGRFWNGYGYCIDQAGHASGDDLRVIGDKKGDLAVRRVHHDPSLFDRLVRTSPLTCKWICVVRNPFDNIATMSLREGRRYDKLRIETDSDAMFHRELKRLQDAGEIRREISPEQIEIYARLCETVATMCDKTLPAHWLDIAHEDLSAAPVAQIDRLIEFLGLAPEPNHTELSAAHISRQPSQTRDLIAWPAAARQRVEALVARYPYLGRYAGSMD